MPYIGRLLAPSRRSVGSQPQPALLNMNERNTPLFSGVPQIVVSLRLPPPSTDRATGSGKATLDVVS